MGDFLSSEKLHLFLLFAVPGIVIMYIRSQFLHGRLPPLAEGVIGYVTVSGVYQALIHPLSSPILSQPQPNAFLWLLITFGGPILVGGLLGASARYSWFKRLLSKAGIQTVHPIDCAWDWHFGNCAESFVMVTLKDDTKWAGELGVNSFASSNSQERDIFIEKVFDWNENAPWTPRDSGVWLAGNEIRSIEIWPK